MSARLARSISSVVAFITAVTLAVLAFVWLGRRQATTAVDLPSIVPGFFIAITAAALFVDPEIGQGSALVLRRSLHRGDGRVALYRAPAIALLHAAGAAAAIVFIRNAFSGSFGFDLFEAKTITLEGFPLLPSGAGHRARRHRDRCGLCRRRFVECAPPRRRSRACAPRSGRHGASSCRWSSCSRSGSPSAISTAISFMRASPLRSPPAFVLAAKRSRGPRRRRCPAARPSRSRFPAPASACCWRCTWPSALAGRRCLLGAALALPALATRYRSYPVLGWLSAAGAAFVLFRFAIDPSIVGHRRPVDDAGVQLAAARLRRAGARRGVCRLAACPHHRRPAAAGDGSGGIVLCADRRGHAGPPRHEWRRSRRGFADACRAGDLHADRHGRQRHPDRARHAFAEPGLPHRLDDRRPVVGRRWWSSSISRCSTRSSPTNRPARSCSSTCCCSPI